MGLGISHVIYRAVSLTAAIAASKAKAFALDISRNSVHALGTNGCKVTVDFG